MFVLFCLSKFCVYINYMCVCVFCSYSLSLRPARFSSSSIASSSSVKFANILPISLRTFESILTAAAAATAMAVSSPQSVSGDPIDESVGDGDATTEPAIVEFEAVPSRAIFAATVVASDEDDDDDETDNDCRS